MATNKEELIVEGYRFSDLADADQARVELEKIELLEKRLDYHNEEMVISVYNRAVMNRTFKTPVGYQYLNGIRDRLLTTGAAKETDLQAIPVQTPSNNSAVKRQTRSGSDSAGGPGSSGSTNSSGGSGSLTGQRKDRFSAPFGISVAMNVILVILVMVMFLITVYSDNPNIMNYRSRILNEYASWEQDLRAREREVRARERELGITPEYPDRTQDEETQ